MSINDLDLLREYARENSEAAFATLVGRHVNLVYSTALRQVRSLQLAEEVTQSVFAGLAQNANKLKADTILTAWLYRVTRCAAIDVVRKESRRQLREQAAFEMASMKSDSPEWSQVEPLLEEAMETLTETDRSAILLRYFENQSLREVGKALGTTEDAAQKRVSRAVEQLTAFFTKRGVIAGSASVVAILSANAVSAAPPGLGAAISTLAALPTAALQNSGTVAVVKTLTMTTMQKALIAATLVVAVGAGVYEARQVSRLQNQMQAHQREQRPLMEQLQQLRLERDAATNGWQLAKEEIEQLRRETAGLPRLRGEVARLKVNGASDDPLVQSVKSWKARQAQLEQRLQEVPEEKIPEFQFLTDRDWLDIARDADLRGELGFRQAMGEARNRGRNTLAMMMESALEKYIKAGNGELPTELAQLKPYFEKPVDDAILQQYKLLRTGKLSEVPSGEWLVTERAPLNGGFDLIYHINAGGYGITSESARFMDSLGQAMNAYSKAHNGERPQEPAQVASYLKGSVDETMLQQFVNGARSR